MDKNDTKLILEHLVKFRNSSDKVVKDVFNLTEKLLPIISDIKAKQDKTEFEEELANRFAVIVELVLVSLVDTQAFNHSLRADYKNIIKLLESASEERSNG